jgi:hypothetical protein
MQKKLYDAVPVHGPQGAGGQLAKAYACTNCMEFFAELSTAYHWFFCDDKNKSRVEYNKWFPHNRLQLIVHDPVTFEVLDQVWKQYDRLDRQLSSELTTDTRTDNASAASSATTESDTK